MARRDYTGNAVPTTTTTPSLGPTGTTVDITSATGWPLGGAAGEFWVTFNRGGANEERALAQSRSGTTITFASSAKRGLDDTTAGTWPAGTAIEHTYSAVDADEANAHINDTALDQHTQYLNTTRHAAISHTQAMMGIDSVGSAQIQANAVGSSELANDAVDTAAIQNLAVTAAKIANGTITATQLAADSVGSSQIAADAVGASEIAANAVGSSELADNAVDSGAIASGAISTLAKFAAGIRPPTAQAAAPGSPSTGDMWVDTDTGELFIWNGTAWLPPWNTAWGKLLNGEISFTTDGSALTTGTNSDFTLSVAVRSDRLYRGSLHTRVSYSALSAWHHDFVNSTDSITILADEASVGGAVELETSTTWLWKPTTGTKTITIVPNRVSGSGTVTYQGSVGSLRSFWIEDIGPR